MYLLILFLIVCYTVYYVLDVYRESAKLPPGPFPLPIIGNLHLLSSKPYLDLHRLGRRYGPLYSLRMGCNRVVVINNYAFAKEAMIKRGADFAGRPDHFVGSLFSRNGKGVGFQTYTETWKTQQKAIISKIKQFARKQDKLEGMIATEVNELVTRMTKAGGSFVSPHVDVTFAFGNIVSALTLGVRYEEGDSEFWQLMDSLTIFVEGLAATSFIDTFPFLKHVPFGIIQSVKRAVTVRDKILNKKFNEHKMEFEDDNCRDCRDLTDSLIEMAHKKSRGSPEDDMTEDHIIMTMNDTIMAGSETPTMNFLWIIYFLVKYPSIQARIQREIDDVVGRGRAPKWKDCQQLPYLEAFMTEVMRHGSVMPLGIPHQAITDSYLGPYQIPKGTTVLMNIYAIHHDPEIWENPHDFNPERFLDEDVGPVALERRKSFPMKQVEKELPFVSKGGSWKPSKCLATKVAIVVPYRDRQSHLAMFLRHIHRFLRWQLLDYKIYIVEQSPQYAFNRGMLMNIGFEEAIKRENYYCVIFHDVDLLPEDDRNDYSCPSSPRHMSTAVDTMKYKLGYKKIFGGVEAFWPEHFRTVNGFPNRYWGWGGEDDDLYVRHRMLRESHNHLKQDGLNSLKYEVIRHEEFALYTLISVDIKPKNDDNSWSLFA
ncbi:hypothetical protein QZH41_007362 [Actinostola sp. cb2023]|nr:hypothetical protein QZH41_007362 [Actinostola sp. cb2023]